MRFVYLIRGNDGKYKIGSAKEPKQRLRQLQTGNSDKLELVEVYQSENARKIESTLHRYYSYVRNVGEWFNLSIKEEVNFVKQCKLIDESIDLLKNMGNKFV
jgi:hypothetical protein